MPVALHAESAGAGAAVVLLHAGLCDRTMWDPQWSEFAAAYRTVRVDFRGFGDSPLPDEPYANARDVLDTLDRLDVHRAVFVGASLGGRVSLELAVGAPDRVAGLLLVAPGLTGYDWSAQAQEYWAEEETALQAGDLDAAVEVNLRTWLYGPGRGPDDVDPAVRAHVARMQRRAFEIQVPAGDGPEEERFVPDLADRLGEITVPTRIVTGDHDTADLLAIADLVQSRIPGAGRSVLTGTAHLPNLERPAEFTALALDFFARCTAPDAGSVPRPA